MDEAKVYVDELKAADFTEKADEWGGKNVDVRKRCGEPTRYDYEQRHF
jgi:hypothetical protein